MAARTVTVTLNDDQAARLDKLAVLPVFRLGH